MKKFQCVPRRIIDNALQSAGAAGAYVLDFITVMQAKRGLRHTVNSCQLHGGTSTALTVPLFMRARMFHASHAGHRPATVKIQAFGRYI
jgi:hypothetical protein